VNRSRLLVGLAAVFAGLSVLMAVLGFVYNLFLLVVAVPFGIVSYALWYHASGRLRERVRRQSRAARRARRQREGSTGGFGAGPREEWTGPREGPNGPGFGGAGGFGGGRRAEGRERARSGRSGTTAGLTAGEAYDVLGLDPGAGPDRIRRAYRERVKDVHPDTEEGDEAAFKRVQEAYERLQDGQNR
jgi:DnaJ-domain-containing protein 1